MKDTKQRLKDLIYILLTIGVLFICIKMVLINKSCANNTTTQDTVSPYEWDLYEAGCTALNFDAIYYIDTTNMCIYYDDYDQFDMDHEYDINPSNINDDGNLMVHISYSNMIELMNRMLQWISEPKNCYTVQALFGIKEIDNEYYVVYLGKL